MLSASLFNWAGKSYVLNATLANGASVNLSINYHPWNTAYVSIGYGTVEIEEMTV